MFRYQHSDLVGSRIVRFIIWDTSGGQETNSNRTLVYREADVFLLCYNIADPASLFSAINHWVPDLRVQAPATPIILVGCQSDRRQSLSSSSSVSSSQALSMSQQIGAVMYVETSSKTSRRGVSSVMEVAALTTLGQSTPASIKTPLPPSPPISKKQRQRSVSVSRENWDGSLRSNSSTLSSTRSDASMESVSSNKSDSLAAFRAKMESRTQTESPKISINTTKTPKMERKMKDKKEESKEEMVSIKCQRLRPDKTYEEVEIQVPVAVYNTMKNGNSDTQDNTNNQSDKKMLALALGSKIKCLFSKTDQ